MLYSHAHHVEEYQDKNGNLKPPGDRNIIEKSMIWILRSLYHFLRFLPAQFFHSSVVMFLTLSEEHFQNSSLILQ